MLTVIVLLVNANRI